MEESVKEAAGRLRAWFNIATDGGEPLTLTRQAEEDLLELVGWVEGIVATEAAAEDLSRVMRTSEFLSGHGSSIGIGEASTTLGMMVQSLTPPSASE